MSFGGSGGGGGSIAGSSDAALSSPANNQVLSYNSGVGKWQNKTPSASDLSTGSLGIALLPAGSTITVQKSGSTWPARPTARTDITVQWKGADPSPAIVASGTGGMLDNVDVRFVTP